MLQKQPRKQHIQKLNRKRPHEVPQKKDVKKDLKAKTLASKHDLVSDLTSIDTTADTTAELTIDTAADTAADTVTGWETELDRWLSPFVDLLGDQRRKPWLPVYVKGLMGPSERKSLTPLASHLSTQYSLDPKASKTHYHNLQQFITYSGWDTAPMERLLAQRADAMIGGDKDGTDAEGTPVLIVDDTALVKKGIHSVGVAHQYCGEVGKLANCQCLVSLTLAKNEVPIPLALRLYLPKEWTDDPERCKAAGVPEEVRLKQCGQTKINIALDEITRVREAGVRFGLVTADAAYGTSSFFRRSISDMGLRYAVGVQSHARVYSVDATIVYPPRQMRRRKSKRKYTPLNPLRIPVNNAVSDTHYSIGRLRVRPMASEPSQTVAEILRGANWQNVKWREGTKGVLKGKYTTIRVRVADGEEGKQREHMPGEIVWLVGEQMPDGRRRYYFTNHPAITSTKKLVQAIRKRWVCEQAHLQLKQELGLDHFEGRSYRGLEHHTFLTMLSFAFLQYLRLQTLQSSINRSDNQTSDKQVIEFMKIAYEKKSHRNNRNGDRNYDRREKKLETNTVKASKSKQVKNGERPSTVTITPNGPACPHCNTLLSYSIMSTLH